MHLLEMEASQSLSRRLEKACEPAKLIEVQTLEKVGREV